MGENDIKKTKQNKTKPVKLVKKKMLVSKLKFVNL